VNNNLGDLYYYKRQYDLALQQYRRTMEIEPGSTIAHESIFGVYEMEGMYAQAIEAAESISTSSRSLLGVSRNTADILRRGYSNGGAKGYWQARLDLAKAAAKKESVSDAYMAIIYARLGQMDTAFERLTKAVDEYDDWTDTMNIDPAFDVMRSDPRFVALEG